MSTILRRIRNADGAVPLVVAYDSHERRWNPPMPLLFQHRVGMEDQPVAISTIRNLIKAALRDTDVTDAAGNPLVFTPHDFRRIFVTDAVLNGMPPHIAQLLCGHRDINTTMGYKAVYPEEVISNHRAFIARRRALRPAEEYRTPTDAEWEEFLGHFERRRVALGDCGRAYATGCIHEHACLRCPLLRPDPGQRPRIVQIRDNLGDRISEAEREGWLGEVEGLKVSLAAAEQKLGQLDGLAARRQASVDLGMPTLPRRRRPHRHRQPHPTRRGAIVNRSTVTPDLLHHLINGSHAEAITCLAVAAVIEHNDRVLLIEAAADELDCCWEPPTDLVLPGETLTDAVHRVAAQAGIDIDHITSYLGHHDILTDNRGDIVRVFGFVATTADPDRVCRLALTPHHWAAVDDLPDTIDRQALRFIDTAVRATGPMREDA